MAASRIVVFTDLDGSLLDHHTYSWEPARDMITRLVSRSIPIVINSSKTFAEQLVIRAELGVDDPFIVENGGGVFVPEELGIDDMRQATEHLNVYDLAKLREDYLSDVHALREEKGFLFKGFSDMSPQDIVNCTGLSIDSATLAGQRYYSEPILWRDSEDRLEEFKLELKNYDLELLKGGRFFHIGKGQSKGAATSWLCEQYSNIWQHKVISIGLGDSQNDEALLAAVDFPIAIKDAQGDHLDCSKLGKNVYKTKKQGPYGWVEGLTRVLNELNIIN